jgi:serine/threonine protein phosphatase PrpC
VLKIADQAFRTDTGRQRNANEDSYFARSPVFVVADGMGGAQAGEVASKTAADAFDRELPAGPPEQVLRQLIEEANREIHDLARRDPSRAGMGTTITAAIVSPQSEELAVGHVGDSRAYRLRDGRLERLTRDHSLVEEMRRKGQLTDEEAEEHPQRSIITRALGPEADVQVDLQTVAAKPGDVYLLTSDGLTTMVDEERIQQLLSGATSLDAAVRALVDEANRAGGRDNITAVAFRLEDAAAPAEEKEQPTLIGPSAAEEGFTADEVRRRTAAAGRRREPHPPTGRRRLRRAGAIAGALLLVGAVVFGAWFGNRQVWFLGTDDGGRVALYRGLPFDLPLGIQLYQERYASPIQTSSLPARRQAAVTGHDLRSRGDAVSLITDIERSQGAGAATATSPAGSVGGGKAAQPAGTTTAPAQARPAQPSGGKAGGQKRQTTPQQPGEKGGQGTTTAGTG